jgi:hypothetical protein
VATSFIELASPLRALGDTRRDSEPISRAVEERQPWQAAAATRRPVLLELRLKRCAAAAIMSKRSALRFRKGFSQFVLLCACVVPP